MTYSDMGFGRKTEIPRMNFRRERKKRAKFWAVRCPAEGGPAEGGPAEGGPAEVLGSVESEMNKKKEKKRKVKEKDQAKEKKKE